MRVTEPASAQRVMITPKTVLARARRADRFQVMVFPVSSMSGFVRTSAASRRDREYQGAGEDEFLWQEEVIADNGRQGKRNGCREVEVQPGLCSCSIDEKTEQEDEDKGPFP